MQAAPTSANIPPPMADIETASDDYATRFKGPSGQWLLDIQEKGARHLLQQAGHIENILDAGGSHAQLTRLLLERDRNLVVAGSAPECGSRLEPYLGSKCRYVPADLLQLPFGDGTFDLVTSFRLLTHCEDWNTLVKELCRTSRGFVLVDYPTSQSINAIAPALFDAKKKVEKNTRYWRSFIHQEVDDAFSQQGFARVASYKQFFLPMALHRMLKCRPFSASIEGILRGIGFTSRWGSPVIALYKRPS
jgi:hypothetical protein